MMAEFEREENLSVWANCPNDILLMIFKNLDMKSLYNSMFVNKYWQDVAEYYCQHFDTWQEMVEDGIGNNGWSFKEKSILDGRNIVLSSLSWYQVRHAAVFLKNHFKFDEVFNICVHKDKLIVVTREAVKYINIKTFRIVKKIDVSSCLKYNETSAITAELTLSQGWSVGYNMLTIINKLHNDSCSCADVKKFILYDISLFKVHLNCCYVIDIKNVLWLYRAENCEWNLKAMAKYYGNRDTICSIHVHEGDVYVLLKCGKVLHVDMESKKFELVCQLKVPMHYLDINPYMFGTFSVLCSVRPNSNFQIHRQNSKDQIVVSCSGLTCAMEHGQVLFLGYEDGKIEIHHIGNLLSNSIKPELQFYLHNFKHISKDVSTRIIAIDIYEAVDGHHVLVATETDVYQFLICDNKF